MKLFRKSVLIAMRPKPDAPDGQPLCPACRETVGQFALAIPSPYLRVRQWLFGHGWMPQAFVALRPCGHITANNHTLVMMSQLAFLLTEGETLENMELVPDGQLS